MANVQNGKAHIYGLSGATSTQAPPLTANAVINMQSVKVGQAFEVKRIKGQAGLTTGLIANDESIELTIDFIPEGTTLALGVTAATLPLKLSKVVLSGFPVIPIGGFADGLNGNFVYEGGGSLNGVMDGQWTGTLPLKKYETDLTTVVT